MFFFFSIYQELTNWLHQQWLQLPHLVAIIQLRIPYRNYYKKHCAICLYFCDYFNDSCYAKYSSFRTTFIGFLQKNYMDSTTFGQQTKMYQYKEEMTTHRINVKVFRYQYFIDVGLLNVTVLQCLMRINMYIFFQNQLHPLPPTISSTDSRP